MEQPKLVPVLKLNDTFASYQALRAAVEKYEKINKVQFWIRDAKRLHRAPPSVYKIVKNHPELEYCSIKLSCIYGGKPFQQKRDTFAKSMRKNRGTFKQDCKAEIFVRLNDEKDRLEVTRMEEEHNHDIPTMDFSKRLPKLREIAEKRRSAKSQKFCSRFQEHLEGLEDVSLTNIVKTNSLSRSKNFEKIAGILQEQYSCTVDLQLDPDEKIYGFFFQDSHMQLCFDMFPEVLLVDGSYRLHNIKTWICTFSVETSLGCNCVVAVGVLTLLDKASIDWLLERFKTRNSNWAATTVLVTDRQSCDHQVPAHFPGASALICPCHALHTFRNDLTQLGTPSVTQSEVAECLQTFLKLTRAQTEEEYTAILEDIEDDMPYPLTEYFYKQWHELRPLWVAGLSPVRSHIEGKLEDPNSRFRGTISGCKTMKDFLERLFIYMYSQRRSLERQMRKTEMKVFAGAYQSDSDKCYSKALTLSGFAKIEPYLNQARQKNHPFRFRTTDCDIICETSSGDFVVSEYSCMCDFFTKIQLPCEHLLVYRMSRKLDLFDECLFSQRWTRSYVKPLLEIEIPRGDKLEDAEGVCAQLAALCGEPGDPRFEERVEVLRQLQKSWENDDMGGCEEEEQITVEVTS